MPPVGRTEDRSEILYKLLKNSDLFSNGHRDALKVIYEHYTDK